MVVSTAVQADNPEVVAAHAKLTPVVPRAVMLAEVMRLRKGIAIAGTHGKTTVTSIVSWIFHASGLEPGFLIGGIPENFGISARLPGAPRQDVDAFEARALRDTGTDFVNVPPRYRSSYFLHIWANGYASGYYAYQWTVMLDDDAYAWFTAHGGLTRANGQRFRDIIPGVDIVRKSVRQHHRRTRRRAGSRKSGDCATQPAAC